MSGGLPLVRRGVVSHALMHVSDWYPSIVHGIAGLEIGSAELDGSPPLDVSIRGLIPAERIIL